MVDFEKAFYSVTFDFISDALEILGFGSVHKKRINSLLGKKQFMLLFGSDHCSSKTYFILLKPLENG